MRDDRHGPESFPGDSRQCEPRTFYSGRMRILCPSFVFPPGLNAGIRSVWKRTSTRVSSRVRGRVRTTRPLSSSNLCFVARMSSCASSPDTRSKSSRKSILMSSHPGRRMRRRSHCPEYPFRSSHRSGRQFPRKLREHRIADRTPSFGDTRYRSPRIAQKARFSEGLRPRVRR